MLNLISLVLVMSIAACTYPGSGSDEKQWDSGAQKEEAMRQEDQNAMDERLNNQMPRPRPQTSQEPF